MQSQGIKLKLTTFNTDLIVGPIHFKTSLHTTYLLIHTIYTYRSVIYTINQCRNRLRIIDFTLTVAVLLLSNTELFTDYQLNPKDNSV